ncbi:MAG: radical SAM protein [Chloroflexi bacterium]|nr:radical SAM protein [Chloroflexota bacterium]
MSSLLQRGRNIYTVAKLGLAENLLSQGLNLLGHTSEKNYERLGAIFEKIANTEQQKWIGTWIKNWLSEGPGALWLSRLLRNTHPNVRKHFLSKSIVNLFFRNPKAWAEFRSKYGLRPPSIILISPSMRCNYRCVGCYAGEYCQDDDLSPEVVNRVITEAKNIGTRFITFVGGEPFVYKPLMDIFEQHNDISFQVYTNGSAINESMAARLVKLGNVAPQISIEGWKEDTDARRGKGAFDRVMKAMDNLRQEGAIFGFSAAVFRDNLDVVTSDEFIDLMIEKGVTYGWYFMYMPMGRDADLSYMLTPEERNKLRMGVDRLRKTKPILLADFFGDSDLTGGCIAAGRIYAHINHKGDVEPCVFCHFADSNVKETSLVEALNSPFLKYLRSLQPFNYNALRPCPMIDNPEVMRTAVAQCGAHPTHDGAESLVTDFVPGLDVYSKEMADIYTPAWERECLPWAEKWLTVMDFPADRIEAKKQEYHAGR